nr:unnamed protein product [Spirometra erinaceieuropaei]
MPLTNLLSGPKGSFELSADALAAFDKMSAVLTDDTPLTHFSPESPFPSCPLPTSSAPGEVRQLDYISQFTLDIRHIDGSRSEVADALSGPSIAHLHLSRGIDLVEMAAEQRRVVLPVMGTFPDSNSGTFPTPDARFSHVHLECTRIRTDSPSSGSQRDSQTISPPAAGLPTRRRLPERLGGPSPLVLLGIRSSLKSDIGCSAAEVVFGPVR